MANQRREANRARSRRNGMSQREPEHREPTYKGEGYAADGTHGARGRSSGSPAHRGESFGPGPVPGAGELDGIGGPGPGQEGRAVRPDDAENPSRATPAGGTPKGDKSGDAAGGEED
jgi:hypothetical protein